MINQSALECTIPLVERLDANRIFLTPVDNSPLAMLVQATRLDAGSAMSPTDVAGNWTPNLEAIVHMSNAPSETMGPSIHTNVMDDVTAVCISSVQAALAQARLVVAPVVKELAEKVSTAVNRIDVSALLGMEVIVDNTPAIFENTQLRDAVKKLGESPYMQPDMVMRLPDMTVEEITGLMTTGAGSLDKEIKQWVSEQGESFFIWLWERAFQQKQYQDQSVATVTFNGLCDDPKHGMSNALAIYLVARRLCDEAPPEGTEMDVRTYDATTVAFRDQAALRLIYALDRMASIDAAGILVLSVVDKKTTVNGRLYRAWIEAGGENEVLFGNVVDTAVTRNVDDLNARAGDLKEMWSRYEALTQTVESNKCFERTKEFLQQEFVKQLDSLTSEELAYVNVAAAMANFNEEMKSVCLDDVATLAALYKTCRRLVCRSRFYYTSAEEILEGLDSAAQENPGMDSRQAGLLSVAQYTLNWLAKQFKANSM